MVQAYRLLIKKMNDEFSEIYPLHLGVTEAGMAKMVVLKVQWVSVLY
jgi:4-hydroxy-3-methylbut-2-en-1-yl diphosphate synthase IspG/GcpE